MLVIIQFIMNIDSAARGLVLALEKDVAELL